MQIRGMILASLIGLLCAWAPGTASTSREAAGAGGRGASGAGPEPGAIPPNRRWAWATTSAELTLPLTASTMPPGT